VSLPEGDISLSYEPRELAEVFAKRQNRKPTMAKIGSRTENKETKQEEQKFIRSKEKQTREGGLVLEGTRSIWSKNLVALVDV